MANGVPAESWPNRAFHANEKGASGQSDVEVLPAHEAQTTSSDKARHKLGQQVNRIRYQRYLGSPDQLPGEAGASGSNDVFSENETRDLARARRRSLSGPGAVACLRARSVDPARIIPASEFVSMGRYFLGIEEPLAARCPCYEASNVKTRTRAHVTEQARR